MAQLHSELHPKLKGGLLGAGAGGVVGVLADFVLSQISSVVTVPDAYQSVIYAAVVFGATTLGHLIFGYLSRWEPALSTDVGVLLGRVEHAVDSTKVAADVSAAVSAELNARFAEYEARAEQVLFGAADGLKPPPEDNLEAPPL
jgi:hypothetical protein